MHFELDPSAPTPPSEQLADQVRFAVAAGRLDVGDRLPSVRELAAQVRINPNTVSRAWRELEREGTLESRRGAGVYVRAGYDPEEALWVAEPGEFEIQVGSSSRDIRSRATFVLSPPS